MIAFSQRYPVGKETFLEIGPFNVSTLIAYQHLSRDVIKCTYTLDQDTWTRNFCSLGVPLKLLLFSYRRFAALSLLINAPQKSSYAELSSLCNSRTVETPRDVFEPDFVLVSYTPCLKHQKDQCMNQFVIVVCNRLGRSLSLSALRFDISDSLHP